MLCDFEQKVSDFISGHRLLPQGGNIVLAVSGGADSVALLHTMWSLKAAGRIDNEFVCAHLNHKLRGKDADGDEKFVVAQAANLRIKCLCQRLDVKQYAERQKLSVETAARQWRIDTLRQIAQKTRCGWIVTGHHKDDNAETIIQRLLRGTGFRGLGGIWPKRTFDNGAGFVRPLLCVTRSEIIDYLEKRKLSWREDVTNTELKFKRNFIRHGLIPQLQKDCSVSLADLLFELAIRTRKVNKKLRQQVEQLWQGLAGADGERVVFDLAGFDDQPEPVKAELIRESLLWLGSGERDLTSQHYNSVLELTQKNVSNRVLELPAGYRVWREYKRLVFAAPEDSKRKEPETGKVVEINIGGKTRFGSFVIEASAEKADPAGLEPIKDKESPYVECFDLDKIKFPLTVRFRRAGDRFMPLGLQREKRVSQILTNAKVPYHIRNNVLVISDTERIIWLVPIRIGETVKVTSQTNRLLRLEIK
ncbi:MAG: tRNA lysidine(34) synthetase TilS [Sedimentisphaerales bacterium]|nr:tRNA lysidine(34) synthetase TilS [Sedimentisphaerales bacterium]